MTEYSSNNGCGYEGESNHAAAPFIEKPHEQSKIKNIIAVVSGKGGVGKSLVTSLMAVTMQRRGYKVGIMDADITGPSIPKVFGLKDQAYSNGEGIIPITTHKGIKVIWKMKKAP